MGGGLYLTKIRANSRVEIDEAVEAPAPQREEKKSDDSGKETAKEKERMKKADDDNEEGADDDEEEEEEEEIVENGNYWWYSYSGLGYLKGEVLRGAVAHLESVEKAANKMQSENAIDGARAFLLDSGITAAKAAADDPAALKDGLAAIASALRILRGWVRRTSNSDRFAMPGLDMLLLGGLGGRGGAMMEDVLDSNWRISTVMELSCCPLELARVGMRGVYLLLRLPDNKVAIYSDEAWLMAAAMEKAEPHVAEKTVKGEGWRDMCKDLRLFLSRCDDDHFIQG